MRPMV